MSRSRISVTALVAFAAATAVLPAHAQIDMNRWSQPVVAGTHLRVPGQGSINGDTLYLPLRQRIEIEAEAEDQFGRQFPQANFRFGFDLDQSCRGLVELEDFSHGTITLKTGGRTGSCDVLYWVPNNMNLDRHLNIQVGERARRGGGDQGRLALRTRPELVAASIYRAIIDRDPDPRWLAAAADEVRREGTRNLVHALLNDPQFNEHRGRSQPEELLGDFYRALLGRDPDPSGLQTYGSDMRRARYEAVINDILASNEFRQRVTRLPG